MRSALSAKLSENSLMVVDGFLLASNKTKEFQKILSGFGLTGKVLIVDSSRDRNITLSSRNLPKVKLVPGTGVNIFDVVNSNMLLFSKDSILQMQEVLSR
jgi:large subunit ribosomal protein L4